jgi:hypothetical protein
VADVLKVITWVSADAGEAVPGTALQRDFTALSAELSALATPGSGASPASDHAVRVAADCKTLGVTV